MFLNSRIDTRPMFPQRTRLAVVRDVAVLAVCLGIVLGFLIEFWRVPSPRTSSPPLVSVPTWLNLG